MESLPRPRMPSPNHSLRRWHRHHLHQSRLRTRKSRSPHKRIARLLRPLRTSRLNECAARVVSPLTRIQFPISKLNFSSILTVKLSVCFAVAFCLYLKFEIFNLKSLSASTPFPPSPPCFLPHCLLISKTPQLTMYRENIKLPA